MAILTEFTEYLLKGDTKVVIITTFQLSTSAFEHPLYYYLSIYEILGCHNSDDVGVASTSK
jgi:hypothetical protein